MDSRFVVVVCDFVSSDGKQVAITSQDTRPVLRIAEPVARFSLLPVPSNRHRLSRGSSRSSDVAGAGSSSDGATAKRNSGSSSNTSANIRRGSSKNLFEENLPSRSESSSIGSLKLPNLLSSSAGSNILSAAATGTNLLSSAAKGMGFLSSATSSYLKDGGDQRHKNYH